MGVDNFILNRNDSALLIIDMQERLFAAMTTDDREMIVKNNSILIETAGIFEMPIVVSEQYRKGLGETINPLAERLRGVETIEKLYFDCLREELIRNKIESLEKNTVIITGIETHVCVLQTALSLIKKGKNAVVVSDAVASRRLRDREMALVALLNAGVVVYPTETVAFMLMEKAGTPEFKKLSPLFK